MQLLRMCVGQFLAEYVPCGVISSFLKFYAMTQYVFRVAKYHKKYGFLSYLQNSRATSAHLAAHVCPVLVCPLKAIVRIQFLP